MIVMDFSGLATLAQAAAPLLPEAAYLPGLRQAAWGMVLAAIVLGASGAHRPLLNKVRLLAASAVAIWALVPGSWGASYWLGLAFQTPSVMACLLALQYLLYQAGQSLRPAPILYSQARGGFDAPRPIPTFVLLGLALGWVLLIDTFGLLPVSVYGWGFHPLCAAVLMVIALLPWVISGRFIARRRSVSVVALLMVALLIFWLLRWPTGNVWDAVLDPLLWIGLHIYALSRLRQANTD